MLLSYLPLSHIAEQMFTIHAAATVGYAVYFAESIEKVPDNLKEVQPHVFFGVPRIWEKFHAGIAAKLREATGVKAHAGGVGDARRPPRQRLQVRGASTRAALLAVQYRLADRLIYSKLKPAIGLGRARLCVSGAAPIAPEVLEFFAGLDLLVHEVYGQSEDTGPTSFNLPGKTKLGTVGPAVPGVEVRIADDGEILVRGPNVFLGYYKEPEATAETLVDGWLHSGDLGAFDADGFLAHHRPQEGDHHHRRRQEHRAEEHRGRAQAVAADQRGGRDRRSAQVPDRAGHARSRGRRRSSPPSTSSTAPSCTRDPALRAAIAQHVDEVNTQLARVEKVKKFCVLPRNFSVEAGELTPTLKVKRKVVARALRARDRGDVRRRR